LNKKIKSSKNQHFEGSWVYTLFLDYLRIATVARVGIVQMTSSAKLKDNLDQAEKYIIEASNANVSLVVFPENFAFMGMNDEKLSVAEAYGQGPIQEKMSQLARTYKIWIIAGTMPIKGSGPKVRSSSIVYDDKGAQVARYDKIHLFDVRVSETESHQESRSIEAGSELVVVDTPIGKVGLTVCYDLRFAELYQKLVFRGAQFLTVPSAFTAVTGKAHWEILLRARAIENLSYILAANQWGHHENGRHTYGHSMVVVPWGKITGQKEEGCGLLTVDVDIEHQTQLRKEFPCLQHHVLA
jgi:nitrilase